MTAHSSLTGTSLHENKGVEDASDDFVATAASNATVWKKIDPENIDQTSIFNVNKAYIHCLLNDVSSVEKIFVAIPFAGTLTKVTTVLEGTLTGADSIVTVKNAAGDSAGTLTIAFSGSLPGDIDTLVPVSNNTFAADSYLTIESNGGSTGVDRLWITLSFTITG